MSSLSVLVSPIAFELERLKREIASAVIFHKGQMGKLTVVAGSSGKAFVIDVENNLEISDEMCDIVSKSKLVDVNSVAGEDLPAFYNWNTDSFTKPCSIVSFAIK
jgi:hypothetical protein